MVKHAYAVQGSMFKGFEDRLFGAPRASDSGVNTERLFSLLCF